MGGSACARGCERAGPAVSSRVYLSVLVWMSLVSVFLLKCCFFLCFIFYCSYLFAFHCICKYSQLHPNAFLTTSTKNEHDHHTTTRLTQHDNRLALCLRVILDSGARRWVQAGHPRYTGFRKGSPQLVPRQTTARQKTSLETNVLSANKRRDKRAVQQPGADSHLESYSTNNTRHNTIHMDHCTP